MLAPWSTIGKAISLPQTEAGTTRVGCNPFPSAQKRKAPNHKVKYRSVHTFIFSPSRPYGGRGCMRGNRQGSSALERAT